MPMLTGGPSEMMSVEEKAAQLDALLIDPALEVLKARLSAFNLFRVLRIEEAEIRHSNVLGWLLDPEESHGLGILFLKRFLSKILSENDADLRPADVELFDLQNIEVRREWMNIDVLVHFESSKKGRWCLLIENKIKSRESPRQLEKYKRTVEQAFPGVNLLLVFLTLDGDDPSEVGENAGFIPWSHQDLLRLTETIVEQHKKRIPEDALVLLSHYLDTLRRLTMQDQELAELCRKIYRTHRAAIDLIVEYGDTSEVLSTFEDFLKESVPCKFVVHRSNMIWFLPTQLAGSLPKALDLRGWSHLPECVPLCFWFRHMKRRGRLEGVVEVGPIANPAIRINFLKALKAAGFSFQEKSAFRQEAKYTRILSVRIDLPKNEEGDPDTSADAVKEVLGKLWEKIWKDAAQLGAVLKEARWKG